MNHLRCRIDEWTTTDRMVLMVPIARKAQRKYEAFENRMVTFFLEIMLIIHRRNIRTMMICPISSGSWSMGDKKVDIGEKIVGGISRFMSPNLVGIRKTKKTSSIKASLSYRTASCSFAVGDTVLLFFFANGHSFVWVRSYLFDERL